MSKFRSVRLLTLMALTLVGALAVAPVSAAVPNHVLLATMNGQEVLPRGADPNGFGNLKISFYLGQWKACYSFTVGNIWSTDTVAIHQGVKGQSGPEVIALEAGAKRLTWSSCNMGVDEAVMRAIAANPSGYYVQIVNCQYKGGAIRGQLRLRA